MVRLEPDDLDLLAGIDRNRGKAGRLHRRIPNQGRVVGHHRQVVQRVDVLDLAGNLQRAGERDPHVAQRHRNRVAVHYDPTALGVCNHAGAVVVPVADSGHGIGHVEVDQHQRRGNRLHMGIAAQRKRGAAGCRLRGRRRLRQVVARPETQHVVALAAPRGEPVAVVDDGTLTLRPGIVELHEPHDGAPAHGKILHHLLEIIQGVHVLAVDAGDQAAPGDGRGPEDVSRVGDVDAGDRAVEVPCLLIREVVEDALPVLDVFVRSDGMQVVHPELPAHRLAAAIDFDLQRAPDVVVQRRRQRHEFGDQFAVDPQQDVAGLEEVAVAGDHMLHHQQPGLIRERLPCEGFGFLRQPEAAQLGVGLVHEFALQGAPRHRLAAPHQVERAAHPIQRQEETRRRLGIAARIQRQHASLDVDHRRAGRAARGARRRLQVEGIEVVVVAAPVVGRLAVQPGNRPGEDGKLLAGIVAHDPDLPPDLRRIGHQRQFRGLDEPQRRGIEAEEPEVVHRVAVHGHQVHFLLVEEDRLGHHRPRRHHMPIRQDQPVFGIHNEPGRLTRLVTLGVERPRAVHMDRNDRSGNLFQRGVPGPLLSQSSSGGH